MSDRESSPTFITESQIFGWRVRAREIEVEVRTLNAERAKLEELMRMAEQLAAAAQKLSIATGGDTSPKFLNDALQELESSDAFPKAVMAIVERSEDGATYDDIKEAILRSPLAKKFKKSDKGFYHALRRLKGSEALVEHHGYMFTPGHLATFLRMVAAGLKDDKSVGRSGQRGSPMTDLILRAIAQNPGAIAKDVIGIVRKESPELDARLSDNDGSAYNAIARLKKRQEIEGFGHLERQLRIGPQADDVYKRLARPGVVLTLAKRTEAPNGRAVGASEVGGDYPSLPFPHPASSGAH